MFGGGGGGFCFGSGARVAGSDGAGGAVWGGGAAPGEVVIRISNSSGSTNISIQVPNPPPPPPNNSFQFGTSQQDFFNLVQQFQQQQPALCKECGKSMEDGHFHNREEEEQQK